MNPLTNVRNIQNLNKRELELSVPFAQSWHQQYRESAWIFIGGLDYDLTEGDIICLFSQYGEVVNINLIRDQKTGKSKGFAFLCYENQHSTVLSVDNLNSVKLCGRTIRVDHVEEYKVPKMKEDMAPEKIKLALEGCAPQLQPPPQTIGAGNKDATAPSIRREENKKNSGRRDKGRPSNSSGPTSDVKTEPLHPDDIVLPTRLFDVGVKTENSAAVKNKSKEKKNKKNKKSKKKNSKSKKSKKSKESSSSSSDLDDDTESDYENKIVRERTFKQKRVVGGRDRVGEGSGDPAVHGQRDDHFLADHRDTVRIKEEPRDRSYSSHRERGVNDRSSSATDGSIKEEHCGRGFSSRRETVGMGGGNDRGSSATDRRVRVKDEPRSDGSDSDSFEGRERNRGHGRQVDDRRLGEHRFGSSRFKREDDHCSVNSDRKRKWEEEENGSRRKYEDRHDRHSDTYRRNAPVDRANTNFGRDTGSNKEYNSYERDASSDKGYDKVRR